MKTNKLKYNWSDKHIEYMRRTQTADINIAEGSIRSGKTTDNVFCFAHDIKKSKDKLHLVTASTQPTAKLIVGDCDGFGLEHIFRGQCEWGKYKGNDCLKICGVDTNYKQKIVLFCGGAKADSFKKFRGISIGLWLATEINLHHKNTIDEALKRQINADIKRIYWDLNPENPNDFIYTDYIDAWQKLNDDGVLKGGFNYQLFNIFDNINLSEINLQAVLSRYSEGTVFYKRDILGLRAVAEGLIYQAFADNTDNYLQKGKPDTIIRTIGIDYGAGKSRTSFKAVGFDSNLRNVYVLAERDIKEVKSPEQLYTEFENFYNSIVSEHGAVYKVFADYGALGNVLTLGLQRYFYSKGSPLSIADCSKGRIIDRINLTNQLIAQNRLKINPNCKNLINAMQTAVWSDKGIDERLDNGTTDIDSLDAFEYALYSFASKLINPIG